MGIMDIFKKKREMGPDEMSLKHEVEMSHSMENFGVNDPALGFSGRAEQESRQARGMAMPGADPRRAIGITDGEGFVPEQYGKQETDLGRNELMREIGFQPQDEISRPQAEHKPDLSQQLELIRSQNELILQKLNMIEQMLRRRV